MPTTTRESANPFPIDGPPNLDDFSIDSADFNSAANVFEEYAKYLRLKGSAIEFRRYGHVDDALQLERRADRLYRNLPEWARW